MINHQYAWVHPDVYILYDKVFNENFISNIGNVSELALAEPHRPRWINYFLSLINLELRSVINLFSFYHQGISIAYPFTIIGFPFVMYKSLKMLKFHNLSILIGLTFYFSSLAFLGNIFHHFMSGKYLALFAISLVFYFSIHLSQMALKNNKSFYQLYKNKYFIFIFLANLFAIYCDEIALFGMLMIPVLFPELFLFTKDQKLKNIKIKIIEIIILLSPIIIYLFSGIIFNKFQFLWHLFGSGKVGQTLIAFSDGNFFPIELFFDWPKNLILNFLNHFGAHFVPNFISAFTYADNGPNLYQQENNTPKILILVAMFFYIYNLATKTIARNKILPLISINKIFYVTLLFFVIQTFINSFHKPISAGYYYGSTFSFILVLLFASLSHYVLLSKNRLHKSLFFIFLISLTIISISNFFILNDRFRYSHALSWNNVLKHDYPNYDVSVSDSKSNINSMQLLRKNWLNIYPNKDEVRDLNFTIEEVGYFYQLRKR